MENPLSVLKKLGLSESEITVFLALTKFGALTVRELIKYTSLKRPTAYYALRQLEDKGLSHKTGHQGVERFQAEDPRSLATLLELRRQEIDTLGREIDRIIPALTTERESHESLPGVSFHEGETAMKQAIMETLYCRSGHIDALTPSDNFFWQVAQSFSAKYIAERVKKKITTRNLWERPLKPEIMTRTYKGLSKVRLMPRVMRGKFRTTVFLYDDAVMYVSSKKSGYVLVVRSKEHYETVLAMFNGLWEHSKDV